MASRRIGRRVVVTLLMAASLVTIVRGYDDPHKVFAFQPFREASTWRAEVYRQTAVGELISIDEPWPGGYRWADLVSGRGLDRPRVSKHAVGSVDSILDLLEGALAYVADHTPRDGETVRLVADVTVVRNADAPRTVRLWSQDRRGEP